MGLLRLALISAIFFILCSGWVALLFKVANLQESRLEKVASQVAQGWASEKQRSQWNSNFNLGRKSFLQHGSPQRIKVLAIVGVQVNCSQPFPKRSSGCMGVSGGPGDLLSTFSICIADSLGEAAHNLKK